MNYFFDVVLPQLLKYFENKNDKTLTNLLVIDVLKDDPRFLEILEKSKNISEHKIEQN